MAELDKNRRLEILQALSGKVCGSCGGHKASRMSHCRKCYHSLPTEMRGHLYRKFGQGYEEAYEASLAYLKQKQEGKAKGRKPAEDDLSWLITQDYDESQWEKFLPNRSNSG